MQDVARELDALLLRAHGMRTLTEEACSARRAPGRWSKKEILGHLIDSACNNHQRFVRMQLAPLLEFPGYEQDEWVRVNNYQGREWGDLVTLWETYNRHLVAVIRDVPAAALAHRWRSPDGTTVDLGWLIRDYVRHLGHHLEQIGAQ